jgi:hypothetical protein
MARLAAYGLALSIVGASVGAPPAAATTIFQLQNVENSATAQAVAGNADLDSDDSGVLTSTDNPAEQEADASVPGASSHGESQASYVVTDTTLELHGRSAGIGFSSLTAGATGYGQATFFAQQDFGLDEVLVHVVGTLTRNDANPEGSIVVSFNIGSYIQILETGVNGSLEFDDVVPLSGFLNIQAQATESQPHAQGVIDSGEVSYDVTMTILPVPEPSTASLVALGAALLALGRRSPRRRSG